jgi:hypothetical protein
VDDPVPPHSIKERRKCQPGEQGDRAGNEGLPPLLDREIGQENEGVRLDEDGYSPETSGRGIFSGQ